MTRQVVFNGATLVRAGGATAVNTSAFQTFGIAGTNIVGVVGEATGGQPNVAYMFTDPGTMVKTFRHGALADAADLLFNPMNDTRVPGGAGVVIAVKVNQATQSTAQYQNLNFTSKDYGAHTNKISYQVTPAPGGGAIFKFVFNDTTGQTIESSPVLGSAEYTVQYVGSGADCTLTINATGLTTTSVSKPADNLNLPFATYATLRDLHYAINQSGAYVGKFVSNTASSLATTSLDPCTNVACKTSAVNLTATAARVIQWTTNTSQLVSAVDNGTASSFIGAGGVVTLAPAVTPVSFAGGARGVSSNSNWQAGFDLLGTLRIPYVTGLISSDLSLQNQGSTATYASVSAISDAHAATFSGTSGKNERENYLGMDGTKAAVEAQAQLLQSPHTVLTSHYVTRLDSNSTLKQFPAWGFAALMAGARAGSLPGEPLVYKIIRCNGLTQDPSWNPKNDGADMILSGVTIAFAAPGGGFKFDRCVTTYSSQDNDALVEESVITVWKAFAYDLRTRIEAAFTGLRATKDNISAIKDAILRIGDEYRRNGLLVDSVAIDGTVTPGIRGVVVTATNDVVSFNVTGSPVEGINFTLNNDTFVPASIAA